MVQRAGSQPEEESGTWGWNSKAPTRTAEHLTIPRDFPIRTRAAQTTGIIENPFNNKSEWGPSNFDIKHNWHFNALYHFPTIKAHGFVDKIANGWWTGNIIAVETGSGVFPLCLLPTASKLTGRRGLWEGGSGPMSSRPPTLAAVTAAAVAAGVQFRLVLANTRNLHSLQPRNLQPKYRVHAYRRAVVQPEYVRDPTGGHDFKFRQEHFEAAGINELGPFAEQGYSCGVSRRGWNAAVPSGNVQCFEPSEFRTWGKCALLWICEGQCYVYSRAGLGGSGVFCGEPLAHQYSRDVKQLAANSIFLEGCFLRKRCAAESV